MEVCYYTKDNLKNFYIRVELQKLTSSRNTNTLLESIGGHSSLQVDSPTPGQEQEEWTFRWQQKAFSLHEEELYADENNCINTVEEHYHREIMKLRSEGGRPNRRLFCYVDKDSYKKPVTLVNPPLTDSAHEPQTFASKNAPMLRKRHISRANKTLDSATLRNPVSETPSEDEKLAHRIITPPSQSMFLMADLRKLDGQDTSEEHVLCHITVYANRMVILKPDFNVGKPAYRLENKHKEVFEYRLEHASQPMSAEDKAREAEILSELYRQQVISSNLRVGKTFHHPPEEDHLSVSLLGEIVSVKGFEYNDLYVTAHLDLPEFWEIEDEDYTLSPRSQLPAVTTQICSTRSEHKYNIAHFGCPFEFSLVHHHHHTYEGTLPKWPRILLEVGSLDYWDRHRIEGYAYVDLPSNPGSYEMDVSTWRPVGRGLVDKMKRFFIGGPPEIDDITYVACPRELHGNQLSRFGFRTETSGSIFLKLNLAHQSRHLVRNPEELTGTAKYKGFKGAVAVLLESYQRAKDKTASLAATAT